ncbi:MAG: type II secretion system protein [Candidatus Nealsonbacteria bacterium]|nr:type II secretion system protein [Candidatus Nealsonbacteria bacterium]
MQNKGFTLIELMVVTGIIVLLTALVLPNYRIGDRQLTLERAAHKLSQDLRRTQEMAMSSYFSLEKTGGEVPEGGYGMRFLRETEPKQYRLFGDGNADGLGPSSNDYDIETIDIEEGVIIKTLTTDTRGSVNNMWVTFIPPDPEIRFSPGGIAEAGWIKIILASENDLSKTKSVYVNKAGLIYVE